jgi:small subunit ribosomal protein S9
VNRIPITVSAKFKRATARATFEQGDGQLKINSVPLELFGTELSRQRIMEVLRLAEDRLGKVNVRIRVEGGGISGQTNAIRTSIASGLIRWSQDPELRQKFMEYDRSMVKGDVRVKESKKPGRRRARAKKQKSYR